MLPAEGGIVAFPNQGRGGLERAGPGRSERARHDGRVPDQRRSVVRRLSLLGAVLAVLALTSPGTALAEPPFRAADRVTDRAGVLDPAAATRVRDATDKLAAQRGYDL